MRQCVAHGATRLARFSKCRTTPSPHHPTLHHRPLTQSTALVYSMEFLEANLEWLQEALVPYHGSWVMEQVLVSPCQCDRVSGSPKVVGARETRPSIYRPGDDWDDCFGVHTVHCALYFMHYADKYILFDCPGQVELFSHHGSLRNIITQLMKGGKYQVGAWLAHGGACFLWCTVTPLHPVCNPAIRTP
jgi:hypothetical protein